MTFRLEKNPRVEAETSIGKVFLFDPSRDAVKEYAKQPLADAVEQIRGLLAVNASTADRRPDGERPEPLSHEQVKALTSDDVEKLATAYLRMKNALFYIAKGKDATPPILRAEGEQSVVFLDRLLRWWPSFEIAELEAMRKSMLGGSEVLKAAEQMRSMTDAIAKIGHNPLFRESESAREIADRILGNSAIRAIEKLQLNAGGLARAIEEAEQQRAMLDKLRLPDELKIAEHLKMVDSLKIPDHLKIADSPQVPDYVIPDFPQPVQIRTLADELKESNDRLIEAQDERERQRQVEREEELKMARKIEEVNIRSSALLVDLSQTSKVVVTKLTEFLVEFKDSTQLAAAGARANIRVAMWSLIVAAGLALVAGIFTIMSYYQDKTNNAGDNQWQAEVSGHLKSQAAAGEKARQDLAVENGRLRQRIEALEKALKDLATPLAKKAAGRKQ